MQFIIKGSVFTSFFYVSLDMLIQTSTAARVLFLQNDIWQLIRSLYVKLPIQLTIALIKTLINFSAVVTKTNLFSVRFQLYRVCLQDNRLCQKNPVVHIYDHNYGLSICFLRSSSQVVR